MDLDHSRESEVKLADALTYSCPACHQELVWSLGIDVVPYWYTQCCGRGFSIDIREVSISASVDLPLMTPEEANALIRLNIEPANEAQ